MKRLRFTLLTLMVMVCCCCNLFAASNQVAKPADEIKSMLDKGLYSEIVEQYGNTPRTLTALEQAWLAEAYLKLDDRENARTYAEMAIRKDKKCAYAYYVIGSLNSVKGDFVSAIGDFDKAIELAPGQSEYYSARGDVYFEQDNYRAAQADYRKAISLPNPCEKAYYMIAAVNANEDKVQQALDTFYLAKSKIVKDKELYVTVLYNIGKIEFDAKNYEKAANAYSELTEYFPDDYYSYEKLVSCYNALGDYSKAEQPHGKLYDAYKNGALWATSMAEMICIDHFTEAGKEITVYEYFQEPSYHNGIKYIFYVSGKENGIESVINLEYVPDPQVKDKGSYRAVMLRGTDKYGFNTIYDGNMSYPTLRSSVSDILQGKIQPVPFSE